MESESDREVERVVCSLVYDDELVLLHREVVQVDLVFWRCEKIAELTELGLEGHFVEKLD